jgi:PAS domain S-box-containing protein
MFTLRFTPLVIPVLVAAALSAVLLPIQLRRQATTGSRSLIIQTTGILIWTAAYGLELVAVDPRARFIFFIAKYLGVVIVPATWFTFALAYTGHEEVLSLRNIALLTIEPVLTILFAATNSLHHLFWTSVRPVRLEVNAVLMVDFGPAFWVHAAYSYLLILAGTILMIRAFIITPHHYRGQVVTLLLSVIAPWAGNVMYISRLNPFPYLDLTPFGFTLTVVFITLSMLRFNLLDVVPIARRHVIQSMSDAMLVLDGYDRILDANPVALHLFGSITPEALFKLSVADLLPPWSAIAEAGYPLDKEPVFKLAVGGDQREYQMNISPVYDQHGNLKGRVIVLRDITRQRQAEQALHESEERFRVLFHHSPDAIVLIDPSIEDPLWPIVDCNEAFLTMNGYSREELIGQSLDMVHVTRGTAQGGLEFLTMIQQHGTVEGENIHRRKDGTIYPIHFMVTLVNLNGRRLMLGVDRDITAQKQAEQALHESEERFRMLFHHSPDAIVLVDPSVDDPSWPIVDCNEAFLAMNGYNRDELIGQTLDTVHVTPTTQGGNRRFMTRLQRGGLAEGEYIHKCKDGTTYPIHYIAKLVNLNGRQLMLGVDRDITERKQAEQALHESEERFRMLFHHSPDAIVLLDPSIDDPSWPIVDCNEAFLAMNGFSREELIGQSIDLVHETEEDPARRQVFLRRLEREGRVESEITHSRRDGTTYPVHFLTALVRLGGKQLVLGIDRDITAQKQAEAEIRRYRDHLEELVAERTAELHDANLKISASLQEKDVLLKEIHHRVKNNLQVISSLLNLQSGYVEDEAAIALFTESRNRVHSMALIHEQLYRSADFTRVDFAAYTQELTRRLLVSYRALANGIDLRLSLDQIFLDVTTAIPCGLIINELVSNALKHGYPDGQPGMVEVEMEVVGKEGYRLVVRNDGTAFPAELDFRNTDSLGLQLVNSLTRQLGGQIDLHTEVDTTFEIRFPCAE